MTPGLDGMECSRDAGRSSPGKEVMVEEHKELENPVEEAAGTRRRAAGILVEPQRMAQATRQERTRSGSCRWVTPLRPRPDLRRFTRGFPVL